MDNVDGDVMQSFLIWLNDHEEDIATGVDDFGELLELFSQLMQREAGAEIGTTSSNW